MSLYYVQMCVYCEKVLEILFVLYYDCMQLKKLFKSFGWLLQNTDRYGEMLWIEN